MEWLESRRWLAENFETLAEGTRRSKLLWHCICAFCWEVSFFPEFQSVRQIVKDWLFDSTWTDNLSLSLQEYHDDSGEYKAKFERQRNLAKLLLISGQSDNLNTSEVTTGQLHRDKTSRASFSDGEDVDAQFAYVTKTAKNARLQSATENTSSRFLPSE